MIALCASGGPTCGHVLLSFKNAQKSVKKWWKRSGGKEKEKACACKRRGCARPPRLPAPALTFTVFRLIKLLLFPLFLIPYFQFLIITFLFFSSSYLNLSIYLSIHPPPLLLFLPSLPPSLSRALSFAESYWSRRRLISPSLRACVMKHMRTELITAIFCRKLISRNKDPKSFFFSIIRSHFHLFLAPSKTRTHRLLCIQIIFILPLTTNSTYFGFFFLYTPQQQWSFFCHPKRKLTKRGLPWWDL